MNNYLPTDYQNFIALSRYARWKEDEQRRETWMRQSSDTLITWKNTLRHKHNYTLPMNYAQNLKKLCLTKTSCQA